MTSQLSLKSQLREEKGKMAEYVRQVQGMVPGVVYGGKENLSVKVPKVDFDKVFVSAGETTIINLELDGGKVIPVLIYDYQRNPVSHEISHVDFYEVDMNKEIKATVPIKFIGESAAVKILAGDLFKGIEEVEIKCLPADLIHSIEVDISKLATFDDVIYVSDLNLGNKVKVLTPGTVVVAKVNEHVEEVFETVISEAEAVAAVEASVKKEAAEGDEGESEESSDKK